VQISKPHEDLFICLLIALLHFYCRAMAFAYHVYSKIFIIIRRFRLRPRWGWGLRCGIIRRCGTDLSLDELVAKLSVVENIRQINDICV